MKEIKLRSIVYPNLVAFVDDEDYEKANQYKWYPNVSENTTYAHCQPKRKVFFSLHRFIMNVPTGSLDQIDHKDGNGLNCTKKNLRRATSEQNNRNRKIQKNNKSGFKGVGWARWAKKFRARIYHNGKRIGLGYFDTAEEASLAYEAVAKSLWGDFYNGSRIRKSK